MSKKQPTLEPTIDEVCEFKKISKEDFFNLKRSARLDIARECAASGWLQRRRHPLWSQTAEAAELKNTEKT